MSSLEELRSEENRLWTEYRRANERREEMMKSTEFVPLFSDPDFRRLVAECISLDHLASQATRARVEKEFGTPERERT